MIDINSVWSRIERWLDANAPEMAAQLLGPATASAIARLEKALAAPLPDDYRASLLRHAGEKHQAFGVMWSRVLRPPDEALASRAEFLALRDDFPPEVLADMRAERGVRPEWWNEKWLPVAENGARDVIALDLAPTEGGAIGQLVRVVTESSMRRLAAPSFSEWLSKRADELDAGRIVARRGARDEFLGLADVGEADA